MPCEDIILFKLYGGQDVLAKSGSDCHKDK